MTKQVSLPTAIQLRDAGWKQDNKTNEKFWYPNHHVKEPMVHSNALRLSRKTTEFVGRIAAPDATELLDALPKGVYLHKEREDETDGEYSAGLDPTDIHPAHSKDWFYDKNPAEALAALWLELRKQKLV